MYVCVVPNCILGFVINSSVRVETATSLALKKPLRNVFNGVEHMIKAFHAQIGRWEDSLGKYASLNIIENVCK